MDELIIWKDKKIKEIREDLDGLFEIFFRDFSPPYEALIKEPVVTLHNMNKELEVILRFICSSNIKIHITIYEDKIFISGKGHGKSKIHGFFTADEIFFKKIVHLPCRVKAEESSAICENGKLKIVLPKKYMDEGEKIIISID